MTWLDVSGRTVAIVAGAVIVVLAVIGLVIFEASSVAKTAASTVRATTASEACGLLSPQEVSAAFGANAGAAHYVIGTCVYQNGADELVVALAEGDGVAQFAQGMGRSAQVIKGLGDHAYYRDGQLGVLKGNNEMLLTMVPAAPTGVSPAVLALAREALPRL